MHKQMMDNNSYNLIMALASNLEALEAYHKYSQDGNQQLWQQAIQHTEQVVQLLQRELPQALQQSQSQQGYASQGQSSMSGTQSGMSGNQYGSSSQSGTSGSQYGSTGSQSGSQYGSSGGQSGMSGNQTTPRQP